MKRHFFVLSFVNMIVALLLPIAAQATSIPVPSGIVNVDFGVTSFPGTTDGPHSPVYSGLGAGPATGGTIWNELAYEGKSAGVGNFGPTGSLLASDGTTVTSISSTLTNQNFYYTDENSLTTTGNLNGSLLDDYSNGANSPSLTISGLSSSLTYDLYIYSQNGRYKSSNATFAISGVVGTQTANNANVNPGALAGHYGDFTLGGNYIVFSGLSGFTSLNVTTTGTSPPINGFQLVALPEPSGLLLLAVAGLPMLRRRRA